MEEKSTGEKTKEGNWWSLLRSGRWKKLRPKKDQLIIGILSGVLLILAALPLESTRSQKKEETDHPEQSVSMQGGDEDIQETAYGASSDLYTKEMEKRLADALSKVEGVGQVQVMITWKSSSEKVVEKDTPGGYQTIEEEDSAGGTRITKEEKWEETTVYQEAEDGRRIPYVVKEIEPEAQGVLVVAQGGGNAVVVQNILEAVQALFPLEAHKIKIMKMEGSK